MSGVYEGYHREWVKDDAFRLGTRYTKCRQPRCPNPPVVEFDRYSFALRKNRVYAYCANHLYGRRIKNGEVQQWILVKDEEHSPNEPND